MGAMLFVPYRKNIAPKGRSYKSAAASVPVDAIAGYPLLAIAHLEGERIRQPYRDRLAFGISILADAIRIARRLRVAERADGRRLEPPFP